MGVIVVLQHNHLVLGVCPCGRPRLHCCCSASAAAAAVLRPCYIMLMGELT
jgi:hypothetical protein